LCRCYTSSVSETGPEDGQSPSTRAPNLEGLTDAITGAPSWDAAYAGTPPWDIGRPQPAFLALADRGQLSGTVLDVGCGTGEHALMAAALNLATTGVDLSPKAIAIARRKARQRGLDVRFIVHDALLLVELGEQFETVLDSGLFHVFDDADRPRYVDNLRRTIIRGGRYHLLCFSDRQPGAWGPRRVTEDEIRTTFDQGWTIQSVERVVMDITIDPEGAQAWVATIGRA
jgi:SAM-dependent methyltransferase